MKKILQLCSLVVLLTASSVVNAQQNEINDLAFIKRSCRDLLLSVTPYATEQSYLLTDDVTYLSDGEGYFNSLTPAGNWKDIKYNSNIGSAWPQSWHLYRLLLVTRSYYKNHNPAYLTAIHRALKFWIDKDFQSSNWWQNQINTPYVFSSLLIMLAKDANQSELDFLNKVLARRVPQENATGQNKIWQHDAEARIALLNNDGLAFRKAMDQMQSVIQISTAEGIQPDYSFHQHGSMLQFGNYGIHFVNSLLFWIKVSAKTQYAFSQQAQQIIVDYCTEGLRYTIFKKGMDLTAIGRQLKLNSATRRGQVLYDDFELIKGLKIGDEQNYSLDGFVANAPKLTINKSFWRSGYLLHSDEGRLLMSVKLEGIFFRPMETVNFENLKGSLLNDGVTLVQRSGKEYRNIEPLWNWTMLPGTTVDTTINPAAENTFKAKNKAIFLGQVSNGKVGIAGMDYDRFGVQAYKSYFFINGMMVALGASIASSEQQNVVTTINQTFTAKKPVLKGIAKNNLQWVWHNNIAYILFGQPQALHVNVGLKKGNWSEINRVSSDRPLSDTLFTAYLSHDKNNGYSYLIKPNSTLKETKGLLTALPIHLFQNSKLLQAIQVGDTFLSVFYQAGEIRFSPTLNISTDKPCMIIYRDHTIWMSDPTRAQQKINVMVNGKEISCNMPQGDLLGSTATFKIL